ncbi:MAG: oxidoreductase [Dehalococcoidia bacterium]|nr:oxidoreductase [Dehalococcoidia bacterium]
MSVAEFNGILTLAIFLPIAGSIAIAIFFSGNSVKWAAAVITGIELVITAYIFNTYRSSDGGLTLVDHITNWIPAELGLHIEYYLAVDGISAPLVLLTGLLGLVSVFASWKITHRTKEHFMWLLALQGAVIGVFTSLDFFLFFLFWELELIPMYFLISIWGSGRKEYSAMKFLIFTILGSAFMLIGILALYFSPGINTFNMIEIAQLIPQSELIIPASWLFLLTIIGFAVKLPVVPFHTWLPDAHTDAPTAASVMLAGVLLKMGGYGLLRVSSSMFPDQMLEFGWLLATLGVINIIYGAAITVRQSDLKKLIAYSSVSHMGFVLLGLASIAGTSSALGVTGAALQMFTHGTITGLLFLTIGFIYDRTHTRQIPELGGLVSRMPILTVSLVIAGLASLGLPGTSGFVAEITIFLGTFPAWQIHTVIGALGVVLTAGYILWMIQRSVFGPVNKKYSDITDASFVETIPIAILIIAIIGVGVYPSLISDMLVEGITPILNAVR